MTEFLTWSKTKNKVKEGYFAEDQDNNRVGIVEVRADRREEAEYLASDLLRMYLSFAERKNWKASVMRIANQPWADSKRERT